MSVMVGYGSVRFVRCGVHITSRRQSPFSTTLVTHDFDPRNPNTISLTMERPKRSLNAYNFFFSHVREDLLESLPPPPEGDRPR